MLNKSKTTWLILSSFGIMFAILSWLQESIDQINFLLDGPKKGVLAFFFGLLLYKYLAKKA
tara:strand:+ start:110480 stop:110662 length:183 start_codon:yes stop_codon:yes gene_type:complete